MAEDVEPLRIPAVAFAVVHGDPEFVVGAHAGQGCRVVQIPSGRKGLVSGPSEDGNECILIVPKGFPGMLQFQTGGLVDAIVHRRAVDGDGDDVVVLVVEDVAVVHDKPLRLLSLARRIGKGPGQVKKKGLHLQEERAAL